MQWCRLLLHMIRPKSLHQQLRWDCGGVVLHCVGAWKIVFHPPPPGALLMRCSLCPISDGCQWGLGSIPKVNKLTPATEWIVNWLPHGGGGVKVNWVDVWTTGLRWHWSLSAWGDWCRRSTKLTDNQCQISPVEVKKQNKKTIAIFLCVLLAILRHWIERMTCCSGLSTSRRAQIDIYREEGSNGRFPVVGCVGGAQGGEPVLVRWEISFCGGGLWVRTMWCTSLCPLEPGVSLSSLYCSFIFMGRHIFSNINKDKWLCHNRWL